MRGVAGTLVGITLLAVTGCSRSDGLDPTVPPMPSTTLTAPSLQPPVQAAEVNPKVTYDPCTRIPDSYVSAAGYNPLSRTRFDATRGSTVTLGCQFRDDAKGIRYQKFDLWIASTNVILDQKQKTVEATANDPQITPIQVHGRNGFKLFDYNQGASCIVYLETKAGYVALTRRTHAAGPNDVCDKMTNLVDLIEPTIGAED